MKPELRIPQGRLRPARASDLDALLAVLHNAQVRRYLCDDTVLPRKSVADMLALSDGLDSQGLGLWVIEDESETFAGIAGLQPISNEIDTDPRLAGGIEPIIALNPKQWGQGLATEALNALIAYARNTLKMQRLVAAVDAPNMRSNALMRRLHFVEVGRAAGPANELILYALMTTQNSAERTASN